MSKEIGELFKKAIKISGAVGAQLSIIKGNEQLDFVHGLANAELGMPMTEDTVVLIGSVTKVFNAMMVMSLVEEGRLDLDAPVKRYIPDSELSDPSAARVITLRHLLSMSSGMDNGNYNDYGSGEDAVAKRVAALKSLPHHFMPGTHYGYANAGSDVAGHAAERVTGKVWDDLLRERVLEPAGLKNAVSLTRELPYQRVAVGYEMDPQSGKMKLVRPWSLNRGLAPAGGTLAVSAHDLARFGSIFVRKGVADTGARILSESSIKTMTTPHIKVPVHRWAASWCLGPRMDQWTGVTLFGHDGGNRSGTSVLYWLPEKNGVIAWTVNVMPTGRTPSVFNRFERVIVQEVMKAVFGVSKPEITAPASPVKIDPQRYAGIYEEHSRQHQVEVVDGELVRTTKYAGVAPPVTITNSPETVSLIPLGDDRFLIDRGAEEDPLELPMDTAFFGDDGHGRATNMTYGVFPTSRKV